MRNPRLSVITVNYNNREGLVKTVESVLGQTYDRVELVVVDGGSTDGSVDYLRRLKRATVKFISERDRGIYHAMQKGLRICEGDAVIFLNAGDWFFAKNTVECVVDRVDISKVIVLGRTASVFGADMYIRPRTEYLGILVRYPAHQGVIVPTHVAQNVEFDERRFVSADTDWILRCLKHADFVLVPSVLSYFELGGVSNSATIADLKKWISEATGRQQLVRFGKACIKFTLRCLFGRRWLYRILLSRRCEFIDRQGELSGLAR